MDLTNGIHKLLWTVGWGWDQNGDDRKPAPLIGRELAYQKYYGRCYAERDVGGGACQLLKYVRLDATSEDVTTVLDSADQLQRPAAVYHYDGVHDDVALTWERMTDWNGTGNPLALRIWLRME